MRSALAVFLLVLWPWAAGLLPGTGNSGRLKSRGHMDPNGVAAPEPGDPAETDSRGDMDPDG